MAAPEMEMEIEAETEQQQQQQDADHGMAWHGKEGGGGGLATVADART